MSDDGLTRDYRFMFALVQTVNDIPTTRRLNSISARSIARWQPRMKEIGDALSACSPYSGTWRHPTPDRDHGPESQYHCPWAPRTPTSGSRGSDRPDSAIRAQGDHRLKKQPRVLKVLEWLLKDNTAGHPITGIKWPRKTLRQLSQELLPRGAQHAAPLVERLAVCLAHESQAADARAES